MNDRPSTAQEVLDAEGWLPLASSIPLEIGSVVLSGPNGAGIPPDCKVVVVGTANIEEITALALRHRFRIPVPRFPLLYKVVAE